MGFVDIVTLLLVVVSSVSLVLAPSVLLWRARSRQATARAIWRHRALALLGPGVVTFVCVVLLWLPTYSGQCGGWLGETSPCSGFGQFVAETTYWAAVSLAMPALLGMLLGVAVMVVLMIRRRVSGPAA
jgi:hypothetical protein